MPPKPFVKYVIGSIGSSLASVLISVFLGPFPLWLELTIFIVPLVLINVALARHKPSTTKSARKSSTLLSVIVWSYLVWLAVDHHNQQKWLDAFEKGKNAFEAGDYHTAQKQYAEALIFAQKSGKADGVCMSKKDLGYSYLNEGQYRDAEQTLVAASNNCAASGNYTALVQVYAGLGEVYQYRGDYQRADRALQSATDTANKNLKPDDPDAALVLNNLGSLRQSEGKCVEGEHFYRLAIDIWERAPGPETGKLVSGYNNLGQVLSCEGRLDEAETFYRKSLDIGEKKYGQDSPEISSALNNLAMLYDIEGIRAKRRNFFRGRSQTWNDSLPRTRLSLIP